MDSLIELPLPAGLWSIVSYVRNNEWYFDLCMSGPEQETKIALLLFDTDVNINSISVNGINPTEATEV